MGAVSGYKFGFSEGPSAVQGYSGARFVGQGDNGVNGYKMIAGMVDPCRGVCQPGKYDLEDNNSMNFKFFYTKT